MEDNEKKCYKCLFWSMWTGVCFSNKEHSLEERIEENEPCEVFEWEESYEPKDKEEKP